ncbi:hypothetical protein Q757_07515, partial [Oenococcus alcoholitolerans]
MCTSIFQHSIDGNHLFSRTMDWHSLNSFPLYLPAGYSWHSSFDGNLYTDKYAIIGNGFYRSDRLDISDGVNQKGLSVQKLTFANADNFYSKNSDPNKIQLAPFEFAFWAMANFASVQELVDFLPKVEIMSGEFAQRRYGKADLHFAACDKSGRFVLIEPLSMPMKVIENPLGVVTNAPNFSNELQNYQLT